MNKDNIIKGLKKETLSSYISEHLFKEKFMNTKNLEYTTDWWISKSRGYEFAFLVKNNVTELDNEIIELLKKWDGINIYQIIIDNNSIIIKSVENEEFTVQQFVDKYSLSEIKKNSKIMEEEDLSIKEEYYDYLDKNNLINRVSKDLMVSKALLGKFLYSTNIDFICKNSVGLFILEVKFKYRTKDGNFGMNKMQYEILESFNKISIFSYNIVLENDWRKKLDILEVVEKENNKWLYSRLSFENKKSLVEADKSTSLYKNQKQQYYILKGDGYTKMNINSNILNLICPCCRGSLVKRKGPYSIFLGCENYYKTECTGKLR